jgi:hypothetical protein
MMQREIHPKTCFDENQSRADPADEQKEKVSFSHFLQKTHLRETGLCTLHVSLENDWFETVSAKQ